MTRHPEAQNETGAFCAAILPRGTLLGWQPLPREGRALFELPHNEVHVWYLFSDRATDPGLLERYARMMSSDEHARRDRFVFAKDRHQFLITRGLVRTVLSRCAGMEPNDCAFVLNKYGKPSLYDGSDRPGFEFNVSHTKGLVAMAVTIGRDVGIDVEDLDRKGHESDVHRYFSAAEIKALEALPPSEQKSRFFDYWTLKEAYIKARGMGLSIPLDSFSIHLDSDRPPTIRFASMPDDHSSNWQLVQFDPSPHHRGALAIRRRGADVAVRIRELDPASNC